MSLFYSEEISLITPEEGLVNITSNVSAIVGSSGITNGICVVFCPHTTAGITINENADPDVAADMLFALKKIYPSFEEFRHFEGNSSAHLKASWAGCQQTVVIKNKVLQLGRWQAIYFCEFDGPRNRRVDIAVYGL